MAFTAIDPNATLPGKAVTTDLFDLVRTNQNDHETRLLAAEASVLSFVPIRFPFFGRVKDKTEADFFRFPFDADINQVRLIIAASDAVGTAGTCEVDILHSTSITGTFTSIFSTRPSLGFGDGRAISTNQVQTSTPFVVTAGDFIRVDIISTQSNQRSFFVDVEFSPS